MLGCRVQVTAQRVRSSCIRASFRQGPACGIPSLAGFESFMTIIFDVILMTNIKLVIIAILITTVIVAIGF